MFDRLTDRARKALAFAYGSAKRLRDDEIEPEHLLLGLAEWERSGAAEVLARIGVSLSGVRRELESRTTSGDGEPDRDGQRPFSPRTQAVLDAATEEADLLGDSAVGTEHLLVAVAAEPAGTAPEVLRSFGASRDRLIEVLETPLPLTPAALRTYATAHREARKRGHAQIASTHLLLALLREDDGSLAEVFEQADVDPSELRRALEDHMDA